MISINFAMFELPPDVCEDWDAFEDARDDDLCTPAIGIWAVGPRCSDVDLFPRYTGIRAV